MCPRAEAGSSSGVLTGGQATRCVCVVASHAALRGKAALTPATRCGRPEDTVLSDTSPSRGDRPIGFRVHGDLQWTDSQAREWARGAAGGESALRGCGFQVCRMKNVPEVTVMV